VRTTTRVFVDDFVCGNLPPVCTITGEQTLDRVTITERRLSFHPAWLLALLAGPVGIPLVILVLIAGLQPKLTGQIPMRAQIHRAARVRGVFGFGASIALVVVVGVLPTRDPDIISRWGVALTATAILLIAWLLLDRFRRPHASLDSSRRWVEITNVHPAFARAVVRCGLNPEALVSG